MTSKSSKPQSFPDKLLRNGVFLPAYLVGAAALVAVMAYITHFHQKLKLPLSNDPADWGAFGDYVGGVLNPLCAYMAFIWLVRAFALQKAELAETRKTLQESHQAQLLHAKISYAAARIETANIRISLLKASAERTREKMQDLQRQSSSAMANGMPFQSTNVFQPALEFLHETLTKIQSDHNEQVRIIADIEAELELDISWRREETSEVN